MNSNFTNPTDEKEILESYLLYSIKGIGAVSLRKLIKIAGSALEVAKLSEYEIRELIGDKRTEDFLRGMEETQRKNAARRYEYIRSREIFFLPFWLPGYPDRLRSIPDPPAAVFIKGKLPEQERKTAAVIGARECSGYGRETARIFSAGLAGAGVTIISGMARGVDGIAQRAALDAGGSSVAVLGCGVDICYPPENRYLYNRLEKEGCLLSEYPPGTQPQSRLFPPRNRIISGLSDLVLVTEAREKSGTLITVDMALEQGKEVFAVPGRITDTCSTGCNRLILNGAGMAVSVSQLLQNLNMKKWAQNAKKNMNSDAFLMRELSKTVLDALDCNPASLDDVIAKIQDSEKECLASDIMEELILLCLEERIGCHGGMYYLKSDLCGMN